MTLLTEFWRGHLPFYRPDSDTPMDREELLESFFATGGGDLFAFVDSPTDVPETVHFLEDGTTEVDLTTYVVLPTDRSAWTPSIKNAAFDGLAETFDRLAKGAGPLPETYVGGFLPFIIMKRDFTALCDLNDWPRPGFWFKTREARSSTRTSAKDQIALGPWFKEQIRLHQEGGTIPTKRALLQLAKDQFKSVTDTAFKKVWDVHAPKPWRRRGRRTGS